MISSTQNQPNNSSQFRFICTSIITLLHNINNKNQAISNNEIQQIIHQVSVDKTDLIPTPIVLK